MKISYGANSDRVLVQPNQDKGLYAHTYIHQCFSQTKYILQALNDSSYPYTAPT